MYPKVENLILINNYECQGCGNSFKTHKDEIIIEGLNPCCSSRCSFLALLRIIKKQRFNTKILLELQKFIEKKDKIEHFNENSAIFSITKYLIKFSFTSLKSNNTMGQGFVRRDKNLRMGQMDNKPPCIYNTGLSMSLSHHSKHVKRILVPSFFEKYINLEKVKNDPRNKIQ